MVISITTIFVMGLVACRQNKSQANEQAAESPAIEPEAPCYAYLHGGDLWLQCGGRSAQVTRTAQVAAYAIAGAVLALEDDTTTRLYTLPTGRLGGTLPPAQNSYWLWDSCGKLWAQDNGGGGGAISLPGGEGPSAVPCMRAIPDGGQPHDYVISPSGRYIAHSQYLYSQPNYWSLCIERIGSSPSCVDVYQGGYGGSVSDSGVVLFDAANGDACLTNGVGAVIPSTAKPPRGFNQGSVCSAVYTWSPAEGKKGPLAEYSTQPQWLSSAEAAALGKLAASPAARRLR